jgi:predicted DNA-binding transcriptional regulator AlpA
MPVAKLLKVPEAAEMLALSQKTVWQWIGQRRIGWSDWAVRCAFRFRRLTG